VKQILIIEDDSSILRVLKDNLTFEGYTVLVASDGKKGFDLALRKDIDMLLLDIMLPGMSGYEICTRLKIERPEIPIIMITARGADMDKISGLDVGADDYVTKPFSMQELMARIRAVFRRYNLGTNISDEVSFGNVKLDFKKFQAFVNNVEVKLSSKEFAIMKYLIQHKGDVVHRHDLLEEVWGYNVMPTTRTVDNFILELRKKLEEDSSKPKHIITIRGIGYKFPG
jgi:DNA-binding response OmpR family regulator